MTDERAWYVLTTVPIARIEFKVLYALNQRELPAMVPFEVKFVHSNRKDRDVRMKFALFPGYVFVQLPTDRKQLGDEYYAIKENIEGVLDMLRRSQDEFNPATLAPSDVDFVRTLSEKGWRKSVSVVEVPPLQPGMEVAILKGPLAGKTAKIDMISRQRISVLLRMLGSMRIVDFTAPDLAVA
jgi:transcription antitermination factor NusG